MTPEEQEIVNGLEILVKHAIKLDLIDLVKDPKEKEAILSLESNFKKVVDRVTKGYETGIALRAYLLFVANRENYTNEEKLLIREKLVEDMYKEVGVFKKGNT
jgi:hypothetical protein